MNRRVYQYCTYGHPRDGIVNGKPRYCKECKRLAARKYREQVKKEFPQAVQK